MTWIPQDPSKDIPVSLLRPPGYTAKKPKTRHPDAACWYHTARDAEGVEQIYPLVFTRDTAGTWYAADENGKGGLSELWDLTGGEIADDGFDVLNLLLRINEFVEQGIFPDDEGCIETRDALTEQIEELR